MMDKQLERCERVVVLSCPVRAFDIKYTVLYIM